MEEAELAEALPARGANHLLANLSNADFELLAPHLVAEDLPLRKQLHRPHTPVEDVHFIDAGLVSIILKVRKRALEVGIIGREGVAGLCAIMQSDRSPNDTVMQIAGRANWWLPRWLDHRIPNMHLEPEAPKEEPSLLVQI